MSSLTRMIGVLDLIEQRALPLDADTICAELGYSRPTGYRYIAELVRAGLLVRVGGGTYGLGPRIIELDYAIRLNDPVLAAATPVMQDLVAATGGDATLAATYGEHVVTTHHEAGPEALILSYGRGRPMPLVRGALSKCLLAWMPRTRQQRIYKAHAREIQANQLGADWPGFRSSLARIRKDGFSVSIGELDPGLVAIAVPVCDAQGNALAALAAVVRLERYKLLDHGQLVKLVMGGAQRVEQAMHAATPGASAKPARKVPARRSAAP